MIYCLQGWKWVLNSQFLALQWTNLNGCLQLLQKPIFVSDPHQQKIYEKRKEEKEVKLSDCDFIQQWNGEVSITLPKLERLKARREVGEFHKARFNPISKGTFYSFRLGSRTNWECLPAYHISRTVWSDRFRDDWNCSIHSFINSFIYLK